jgi:hypothetical protein
MRGTIAYEFRTDMAIQQNLSNLTFKDLFVSPDAKEIAKKLVTALIEQQIGQELGVSRTLRGALSMGELTTDAG